MKQTGNGKRKERDNMIEFYRPEGGYMETAANKAALDTVYFLNGTLKGGNENA